MTKRWIDLGNGRKVFRSTPQPRQHSGFPCPRVVKPFDKPVQSMADGKWYDNPRDLERTYRADGNPHGQEFVALGNETMPTVDYTPDSAQRRDDIRQAMHDVVTGNLPPEIAAIE